MKKGIMSTRYAAAEKQTQMDYYSFTLLHLISNVKLSGRFVSFLIKM